MFAIQDLGGANETFFFATAGTLVLDSASQQLEGYPQGSLTGVTLREATVDDTTYVSTLVPGGKCLTMADASFIVNVTPVAGWTHCPLSYYGDGDCDCGCGAQDVDCTDALVSSCAYCWCEADAGSCSNPNYVMPTDNATCSTPG